MPVAKNVQMTNTRGASTLPRAARYGLCFVPRDVYAMSGLVDWTTVAGALSRAAHEHVHTQGIRVTVRVEARTANTSNHHRRRA